jgi:hypothetical protein
VQTTNGAQLLSMASVTEAKGIALISWEVAPVPVIIHLFVVVMARLMPTCARQPMQVSTLITQAPVIQTDALRGECNVSHRNLDLNFELYVVCVISPFLFNCADVLPGGRQDVLHGKYG